MTHAERSIIHHRGTTETESRDRNDHGGREGERDAAEEKRRFGDGDGCGETALERVAGEVGEEIAGDGEEEFSGVFRAEEEGEGVGGDGGAQDLGVGDGDAVGLCGSGAEEGEEAGGGGETDEVGEGEGRGEEENGLRELEGEPERGGRRGGLRRRHVEKDGRKRVWR